MSYPNNVEPMQLDASNDDVDVCETSDSSHSDDANHQVDSAPFEVESYVAQYSGYGKLIRLIYIADHCPPLQIDALELALKYVKESTSNVPMYMTIQQKLLAAMNATGDASIIEPIDNNWIEKQTAHSQMMFEKLETDLKNYKTNSIKESIRRGHDDLGSHYLLCGDLSNALKCYTRSRDYCMGDHHLFTICLNVIKLNIYLQNWSHVSSYIQKAETAEFSSNPAYTTRIHCIAGLRDLIQKSYKSAAERFVKAIFDDLGPQFSEIMSPNNIAIYGGLCALASFDRDDLRKKVLNCPQFKLFLELEPQLREAINRFLDSKYPECLKLLDELKDTFLLDLYLASHVKTLYNLIRNRALIQYFTPYLSADLGSMALAFNTSVESLEDELMRLILDGQIQARIDSHNKILYAKDTDPRLLTFGVVLDKGREWQMKATALMLRAACARNGMIIIRQSSPQQPQSNTTSSSTSLLSNNKPIISSNNTAANNANNELSSDETIPFSHQRSIPTSPGMSNNSTSTALFPEISLLSSPPHNNSSNSKPSRN